MLCSIDGDFYEAKIPRKSEWAELQEVRKEEKITFPKNFLENPFFVRGETGSVQDVEASFFPNFQLCQEGNAFALGRVYGVRLCLIPLNKEKQDISKLFQKDNPNGSVVKGGTFSFSKDKNTHTLIHLKNTDHHPVIREIEKTSFLLGDSSEEEDCILSWVCWNGHLWCQRNVIEVDVMRLPVLNLL